MELAKRIVIPVLLDYVLTPDIYYGDDITGIYFQTSDAQFGRILLIILTLLKFVEEKIYLLKMIGKLDKKLHGFIKLTIQNG